MEFTKEERDLFKSMASSPAEGGRGYGPVNEEECRLLYSDLNPDKEDMWGPGDQEEILQECIARLQEKKCNVIIPYKKYVPVCAPMGWKQMFNDCWLDSTLYILFASDLANRMVTLLEKMNSSDSENTRDLAKNIYNYLQGISNYDAWITKNSCKQIVKRNIYKNIINYFNDTNNDKFDTLLVSFQIRGDTYIGNGSALPLLHLLGDIESSLDVKTFIRPCESTQQGASPCLDKITNYTEELNSNAGKNNIKSAIIIIQTSGKCRDVTPFIDYTSVKGWNLKGVIVGSVDHYRGYSLCQGKWYDYNNQNKPTLQEKIDIDKPLSMVYGEVIFFYEKVTNVGGKRKSRRAKRTKKYRKSRKNNK